MENIGKKIKQARKSKKLTQDDLAKKIGVTKHAIAKYEQGQREPNLDILTKIVDELEIDFWQVAPSMDMEIEAVGPYEEGIEFANEVCRRVHKNREVGVWLFSASRVAILDEVVRSSTSLGVNKALEKSRKEAIASHGGFDHRYANNKDFEKFKEEFYEELVDALLFTVELKLKEADKRIKK